MYLEATNPNAPVPENNRDRRELLVGDIGERVIPIGGKKGAFYNPNYINPNKLKDSSLSPNRQAAGVSTNYGVVPKINEVRVDPETGEEYQVESGTAIFAIGPGTGAQQAGFVPRLRTPMLVKPMKQQTNAYNSPAPKLSKGNSLSQMGKYVMDSHGKTAAGIHLMPSIPFREGRGRHDANPHSLKNIQMQQQLMK